MLNHITIMGRLVRDPELRRTATGAAVASFTVAVDRDFAGKDGGKKETDFIDCVAWRSTGEFVAKSFAKGSMIVVSGRLQMRNWTDRDGNKRVSAEVVANDNGGIYFAGPKNGQSGKNTSQNAAQNAGSAAPQLPWEGQGDYEDFNVDEGQLPF